MTISRGIPIFDNRTNGQMNVQAKLSATDKHQNFAQEVDLCTTLTKVGNLTYHGNK
jgi:hypothetical protein